MIQFCLKTTLDRESRNPLLDIPQIHFSSLCIVLGKFAIIDNGKKVVADDLGTIFLRQEVTNFAEIDMKLTAFKSNF